MALAVRAAQMGKRRALVTFLILTILLGLAFVLIKLTLEWRHDYLEGLAPGLNFTFAGPNAKSVEMFFCFYFIMTGVHALHMVVGVGVLTVLLVLGVEGSLRAGSLQCRGNRRPLLALRGHRLDFSLPASVFNWRAILNAGPRCSRSKPIS